MARKTRNPRIAYVPSDRTLATLRTLSELSGQSMASLSSELMDEACPVLEETIAAVRKVKGQPERVREFMDELANYARNQIAAAIDSVNQDLPLPMQDKRRSHHKREAAGERRRAG